MYTNSYIVSTGKKECVLIDPGADGDVLIGRLEAMNLIPQAILFTHGHIDHTSAARDIVEYYAGRNHHVPVGIHHDDAPFLGSSAEQRNHDVFAAFGDPGLEALQSFSGDIPEPEFFYAEGETIGESDLLVMHTPGHSDGSVCLYSEPRNALFTGDTLFFNTIGRTDLPDGNSQNLESAVTQRLFELPPGTRVFPGHGPLTSIEREIKNNPMDSEGATI
jgi:glyoxylase-like metal-dependent hydrolase (beta-lactamase superfamily II)